MRVVVQRVSQASVIIGGRPKAAISSGLLILVAVEPADSLTDVEWLAAKLAGLRVFPDAEGLMNRSVREIQGEALVISQFTLYGSTRKGTRPSYSRAAKPELAIPLYEAFLRALETELGRPVAAGEFGAHMEVALVNDGPVTLVIDTRRKE